MPETMSSSLSDSTIGNLFAPTAVEELLITPDVGSAYSFKLNKLVATIGRDGANDVVVNTGSVSRFHARMEWAHGVWALIDLGSTNGTMLAGKPVKPHTPTCWPVNEQLIMGKFMFELRQPNHLNDGSDSPERTQFLDPDEIASALKQMRAEHTGDEDPQYHKGRSKVDTGARCTVNMWPSMVNHGQKVCVAIQNEGHQADRFSLALGSESEVAFSAETWEAIIPAGLEKRQYISIYASKRHLIGPPRQLSYDILVQSELGNKRALSGQIEVTPRLNVRVLQLLSVMLMLLAIFTVSFLYLV